jgi:sulfate transport system ATP-binding protein
MSIAVDRLLKTYGDHAVVNQVSFEVADGECFVLLGPSGSGKSTVLRIVAGLTEADAGRVTLQGVDVTAAPPQRRGTGMVFQQYALFGHMTVADNVEFPLRVRKVPKAERAARRNELLELVGLVGLHARYPHQLSGGQQQRVALARALAHRPEVLLLDEPFGALDAQIRAELRRTLRHIQRELEVTTIFVTHDQEEAFELADRLAVMNYGRLLEVGPPQELYHRPQTEFVATFLGKANLFVGEVAADGVRLGEVRFPLASRAAGPPDRRRVQVLFRPEDVAVKLTRDALEWPALGEGTVEQVDFSGSYERLRIRIPSIAGVRSIAPAAPFGADYLLLDSTRSQHLAWRYPLQPGDRAWVGVRRVHALAHRGLSFCLVDDGTPFARDALDYGGRLARLCHARVTVLVVGDQAGAGAARAGQVRETLGSGLAGLDVRSVPEPDIDAVAREAAREPHDLLVVPRHGRSTAGAQDLLRSGVHHVLVVPRAATPPRNALVCTAAGEPAKNEVLFAGRLVRHTGAAVTLFTAVPDGSPGPREQVQRFHAASSRTLSLYGIEARAAIGEGPPKEAIVAELQRGGYDFLVLGVPLPGPEEPVVLGGLVKDVLSQVSVPTLVVRPLEDRG